MKCINFLKKLRSIFEGERRELSHSRRVYGDFNQIFAFFSAKTMRNAQRAMRDRALRILNCFYVIYISSLYISSLYISSLYIYNKSIHVIRQFFLRLHGTEESFCCSSSSPSLQTCGETFLSDFSLTFMRG